MCPRPDKMGTRAWPLGPSRRTAPIRMHTAPLDRMSGRAEPQGPPSKQTGEMERALQTGLT